MAAAAMGIAGRREVAHGPEVSMLNLASLKRRTRHKGRPLQSPAAEGVQLPHRYTMMPGATPKAMTSDSESYSFPNAEVVPVMRATLPSSPSMNPR